MYYIVDKEKIQIIEYDHKKWLPTMGGPHKKTWVDGGTKTCFNTCVPQIRMNWKEKERKYIKKEIKKQRK